ncbi:MAG: class I SAM-dependent methyltransferase [Rhizomicrobium sp.]
MIRPARWFISANLALSRSFERLLPKSYQIDGYRYFTDTIVPTLLRSGERVVDCGGGKKPLVSLEEKRRLQLTYIGVDIDGSELAKAPADAYDAVCVSDITRSSHALDADLVICRAVMEHVRSAEGAMRGLAAMLKPGGTVAVFLPSRRACFSVLNLLLPESAKRRLLFWIYPHMAYCQGFQAYYDRATIPEYRQICAEAGLQVRQTYAFYCSTYFQFFFPLHLVWRGWILVARALFGEGAAETFVVIAQRLEAPAFINK